MRSQFLLAFVTGLMAVAAAVWLRELGPGDQAAGKLATFYANAGLIPPGQDPGRTLHYSAFILLGLLTAWTTLDLPQPGHKALFALAAMILVLGTSVCLAVLGFFFEPFTSLTAIGFASAVGLLYAVTEKGARKRILHQALGGRVSQEVFAALQNGPRPAFLSGTRAEVTVLTIRVFNHAHLIEEIPPPDLVRMTGLFLRNSGEFLTSRGAYLDESSPDHVRVIFGIAPAIEAPESLACEAALELHRRLTNLNETFERRFFHSFDYGIAIGSEPVTLGICQSGDFQRLSAVGDLFDYLRKLSAANGAYGSSILVNASAFARIRDTYAVRPMELLFDARTGMMSEAYELLDRKDRLTEAEETARKDFWQAVIFYREDRAEEALEIFSRLRSTRPNDRPLAYFIEKAQQKLVDIESAVESGGYLMRGHARILQTL